MEGAATLDEEFFAVAAGLPDGDQVDEARLNQARQQPGVEVTPGHRGMLVMMQFMHTPGPFCRDCGLATFREMSAKTLIQGWYGYLSFVITPITVLLNLIRRGKVASLAPPRPPAYGPSGRPMDPGSPLLTRPSALIGLGIPFALILLVVFYVAWRVTSHV